MSPVRHPSPSAEQANHSPSEGALAILSLHVNKDLLWASYVLAMPFSLITSCLSPPTVFLQTPCLPIVLLSLSSKKTVQHTNRIQ